MYFICFLESILSKLQKIPGLYVHLCKCVFLFHFYSCFFAKSIVFHICICCVTELEGKDVEDLFTAVLSPSTNQPPPPPQVPHPQGPGPFPTAPGTRMPHHTTGTSLYGVLSLRDVLFCCFCELFQNMCFFNCVQEIPCFHGCR